MIVAIVAAASVSIYIRIHSFNVEDDIHHTFYPLAVALDDFAHDHNSPATNLTQLVPRYIAQLPRSRYADSIEYCVLDDGKAWQLSIHSSTLSPRRVYCCRSPQKFTANEERKILLRYHSVWTVLRE